MVIPFFHERWGHRVSCICFRVWFNPLLFAVFSLSPSRHDPVLLPLFVRWNTSFFSGTASALFFVETCCLVPARWGACLTTTIPWTNTGKNERKVFCCFFWCVKVRNRRYATACLHNNQPQGIFFSVQFRRLFVGAESATSWTGNKTILLIPPLRRILPLSPDFTACTFSR